MAALLTRTRSILTLEPEFNWLDQGRYAYRFVSRDDDNPERVKRHITLTPDEFFDMGRPEQITLSLEPGDHLNEGD